MDFNEKMPFLVVLTFNATHFALWCAVDCTKKDFFVQWLAQSG